MSSEDEAEYEREIQEVLRKVKAVVSTNLVCNRDKVVQDMKEDAEKGHTEDDDGAIEAEDGGDDDWEFIGEVEFDIHDQDYISLLNELFATGDVSRFIFGGYVSDDDFDDDDLDASYISWLT